MIQKTVVVNVKTDLYDVYIGRPSKFGNPFEIGKDGTRKEVIDKFIDYFLSNESLKLAAKAELTGKRLGCFCKPKACHGDIIAKYVNDEILIM